MYFKRIEMHGFKSFAEPVVIEFHEGVTCIVGPNGSGKSNISDAIRWVLGEQSPKMLRGGKMEEVIFSGTASRKSRGMAEVTLVIDNTTGILPIDYNEVAITRRMYRSGESEYLINNNQCRLRDIRELIMDTGIGVDGYSIIGQGKIADIVSSKPESRREIFEEAAGVVMYKSRKAEAERKLSTTSGNLERVNDIIGEIEGRIEGLREDSQKAKEYLELKEKYRDLEINLTLKNIEKLESVNASLKNDTAELASHIENYNETKRSLEERLGQDRSKNEDLELLGNEARDKLLLKVEEINRLTNQSQLNTERLHTIDRDETRLKEESKTLREKLMRELENADQLQQEKTELTKNLAGAERLLAEKVENYNQITAKATDFMEIVDDNKNQMFQLHSQVSSKRSEAKTIESYKESLLKRKEQLRLEGESLKNNTRVYESSLKKAQEEKEAKDIKEASLKTALKEARETAEAYSAQGRELSKKREDIRIKSSQLISRKRTIEEMEHNYEGYQGAVKYIMKKEQPGVYGVVADLMQVPAGYEIAIETALGSAMQNIVCKRDADAKAAIRLLKENKAGRATFLPLESVKGTKIKVDPRIEAAPGYKGLGADCIQFDSQYEGIFQYLLGRVAIVDHMDHAIALSKLGGKGLRFVTMDGEIINVSGAITGGKYKNATANLLERKQEIFRLETQIQALIVEGKQIEEQISSLSEKMSRLHDETETLEETYQTTALQAMNLMTKIQALTDNGKELSSSNEKKEKEVLSIEKELAETEKMTIQLLEEADRGDKEIQVIQNKIEEAMKTYEELKSHVEQANEEITQTRIARNEWAGKVESYDQLLARVKETGADFQTQLDTKELQIEALRKERQEILFGSEDAAQAVIDKEKEKADLEEYISKVSQEKMQLASSIQAMTAEQSEILEKLNRFQDQKYQMEIKLTKNDTQLDTFKEKLWEEFEVSYLQAMEFKKQDFVMSNAVKESREIKNRIRELGDVNVGSIKEYEQVSQRYEFLTEQRTDILTAMNELKSIIQDMDKTMRDRFKENFDQIVIHFEDIFKQLFGGGHAELRLDDEENPLEAGIEIIAQPPGKKLQNINLMSGGEKTMTAIALMFAVLKTKPTPFCILDEVEAALDDANIDRFAAYLRNFHNIQFAIVTHQKATMEHADVLYGVTMPEQGISKVLSLRLGDDFEL